MFYPPSVVERWQGVSRRRACSVGMVRRRRSSPRRVPFATNLDGQAPGCYETARCEPAWWDRCGWLSWVW